MSQSIFQSREWAQFKIQTGYRRDYWIDGILVLEKRLPLRRSMLYSPRVSASQKSKVESEKFLAEMGKIAGNANAIFYRLELDIPKGADRRSNDQGSRTNQIPNSNTPSFSPPKLGGVGGGTEHSLKNENCTLRIGETEFRRAFEEMQPEHTLILDISQSEDAILAQMKPKCRYNIKLAREKGVVISSGTDPVLLEQFYGLYQTMAERQKITYRGKSYFDALLAIMGEKGYVRVYSAETEIEGKTEVLAAAIILHYNGRATYLYGGSSNEHRNLMAPQLLHWQAIGDAKANGCTEYDFFGIAPNDDPNHPWAGITRFKKGFGGKQVDLLGSWDLVLKPMEYRAFKWAESIRRRT